MSANHTQISQIVPSARVTSAVEVAKPCGRIPDTFVVTGDGDCETTGAAPDVDVPDGAIVETAVPTNVVDVTPGDVSPPEAHAAIRSTPTSVHRIRAGYDGREAT